MHPLRLVLLLLCAAVLDGLAACNLYDDGGGANPGTVWPWVCSDGAPAPEAGCPPAPGCVDGGDAGPDGGC